MEEKSMDAAEDHISKLPVPILQHFLSLLLAKDAAQISTFSKSWYTAWTSLSHLNFGDKFFYREVDDRKILSEKILELLNIVDQTLANQKKQKVSIQKFCLTLPSGHCSSNNVHNWIKTLVATNIKELILIVGGLVDSFNTLPEEIFASKGLNALKLRGFKLELPLDGIKFSSLRKLDLSNTYFDEQFLRALCASCSGLEKLSLSDCHGLASLQIAGTLPKLKRVWLRCLPEFQMADIVAPNLEDLYIEGCHWKLQVIKITCCKALKNLSLANVNVTDECLEDLLFNPPNLKYLNLSACFELQTIKISSDQLEYLALSSCFNLIDVELDTPNLTRFNYDFLDQLPTLKLMKASVLLEVELYLIPGKRLDNPWYSMLMKFLGNFKQSKAIKLDCWYWDAIVIPKDMRKKLVPPLHGTTSLHTKFEISGNNSLVDILDSLVWISPQLDTLSFVRDVELTRTMKFIYEDASAEDEKTIWRHKLKEVKMENFTSMEQQELRNYLFRLHRRRNVHCLTDRT
ncbi:uncharacterized protein LOC132615103 [Lycium barbarum]|uniref:uncharacterized protein LOC132615103 n=1 Tax=Lycium barbarum TaxID=112863 RepID=UPI00293E74A7|nr:uncharacterized protein LOC132615103 [Lycium barbarum]